MDHPSRFAAGDGRPRGLPTEEPVLVVAAAASDADDVVLRPIAEATDGDEDTGDTVRIPNALRRAAKPRIVVTDVIVVAGTRAVGGHHGARLPTVGLRANPPPETEPSPETHSRKDRPETKPERRDLHIFVKHSYILIFSRTIIESPADGFV